MYSVILGQDTWAIRRALEDEKNALFRLKWLMENGLGRAEGGQGLASELEDRGVGIGVGGKGSVRRCRGGERGRSRP